MKSRVFDRVIIGSSPVAVMCAVKFARAGFKVALVEKNQSLGGAWRSYEVEDLGSMECACHLIEFYSGVYETISDLLEIDFTYLEPQPIKIFNNGKYCLYTTRLSILRDFFKLCFVLAGLLLVRSLNLILPASLEITKGNKLSIKDFYERIWLTIRYRILKIFEYKGIKAPVGGYTVFSKKLQEAIEKNNIYLIHAEVKNIHESSRNECELFFLSGDSILAMEAYLTESTYSNIFSSEYSSHKKKSTLMKKYWHIIVSVKNPNHNSIPSYIHLPDNKHFHRITTSTEYFQYDKNDKVQRFLVQTRKDPGTIKQLRDKVEVLFKDCHISRQFSVISIHKVFSDEFMIQSEIQFSNSRNSKSSIKMLRTFGDLGKSLVISAEIMVV